MGGTLLVVSGAPKGERIVSLKQGTKVRVTEYLGSSWAFWEKNRLEGRGGTVEFVMRQRSWPLQEAVGLAPATYVKVRLDRPYTSPAGRRVEVVWMRSTEVRVKSS